MKFKIITKAQFEDILFDTTKLVVEKTSSSADVTVTTLTVDGKVAAKRFVTFTGPSYLAAI